MPRVLRPHCSLALFICSVPAAAMKGNGWNQIYWLFRVLRMGEDTGTVVPKQTFQKTFSRKIYIEVTGHFILAIRDDSDYYNIMKTKMKTNLLCILSPFLTCSDRADIFSGAENRDEVFYPCLDLQYTCLRSNVEKQH